jgi:putative membrane protein
LRAVERRMKGFLLRTLITALGLWLASAVVPGIVITSAGTLLLAAVLTGAVNALVRPIVIVLTLPLTVVTLGLFLLAVNAAMFGLVAWILPGFRVSGFFAALFGWLIVSLVAWLASSFIGPEGRYQILVAERRR